MVEIDMGNLENDVLDGLVAIYGPKLLEVCKEVPGIIKDRAILDNEDVYGNQMPQKKPRPKRNPTNFPNLPLIWNDEPNMMANERWTVETTADLEVTATYAPPDHFQYMKDLNREWITETEINPTAREQIEQRIIEELSE